MENSTITWIFLGIVFLLFVISSIILIAHSSKKSSSISNAQSSSDRSYWKVVKGKVAKSRIDYRNHKRLLKSPQRQYCARITYSYFAYDKEYSHTVALNEWTEDKSTVKKLSSKHQPGDAIIVRFHPKSAERSIVEINR